MELIPQSTTRRNPLDITAGEANEIVTRKTYYGCCILSLLENVAAIIVTLLARRASKNISSLP